MADSNGHGTDHGHTPAAWTGVIIAFVGFLAGGYFLVAGSPVGFWASIGVIGLAAVVGGVMSAAGMGKPDATPVRTAE
ncbi:hypothetical protein SRB5_60340 [Streptomyces sp. RB5]|uniref:Integral membrane protein n=1 Tax=Streptomyces smaragdinus TaxID=2585196 RepID=A0A7K0CR81_9ACTN|nr:HGxxPAAW family protein [Streptomyces smaragdinus]MQY15843.1 hypothetical protein [Streptomyces smaragdinus]